MSFIPFTEKNWNLLDPDPELNPDPDPLSRKWIPGSESGSALQWSGFETLLENWDWLIVIIYPGCDVGAGVPDGEIPEAQARDWEAVKETRKEESMSHLNSYPFLYFLVINFMLPWLVKRNQGGGEPDLWIDPCCGRKSNLMDFYTNLTRWCFAMSFKTYYYLVTLLVCRKLLLFWPGVYIKFEIHIPPPFLIYIFSPTEIYVNEGVRAACEKFAAFFCSFVKYF